MLFVKNIHASFTRDKKLSSYPVIATVYPACYNQTANYGKVISIKNVPQAVQKNKFPTIEDFYGTCGAIFSELPVHQVK